jgi:hypothetical protein
MPSSSSAWVTRRRLILAAVAAIVVLAAVVVAVSWPRGHSTARPAADASSTKAPPAVAFTSADSQQLVATLGSGDPATAATAIAAESRDRYAAAPAAILPSGDTLVIDPTSFAVGSGGPAYGTAVATATGALPGTFVVYLVYEQSRWRVLGTARTT